MLFPVLFGHMTFASHRCWTVFIKKAVFLAAEAWRKECGTVVRHAALKDGGGEVVQYIRAGMDPYPMVGWRRMELEGGEIVFEGPNGERYADLQHAFEQEVAAKVARTGIQENRLALTFLQKFLNECCSEQEQREESGQRFVVATSTLEDWLYRGDHPILAPMSFEVYAMYVYRVEKPHRRPDQRERPRFIDIEFAAHYSLRGTHRQRLATEFRVPLFEGFTMPSSDVDSETAAMYKQLLLRPLSVLASDDPEDIRIAKAFAPLSSPQAEGAGLRSAAGAQAFTRNWLVFAQAQQHTAMEGRRRFMDRYEWPSLWGNRGGPCRAAAHVEG